MGTLFGRLRQIPGEAEMRKFGQQARGNRSDRPRIHREVDFGHELLTLPSGWALAGDSGARNPQRTPINRVRFWES